MHPRNISFKILKQKEPLVGLMGYLVFDQRSTIVSLRYLLSGVSSCAFTRIAQEVLLGSFQNLLHQLVNS